METDESARDEEKLFAAWLQTALEYDKSLLVVASAGLGLIASLADKVAALGGYWSQAAILAAIAFSGVVTNVLVAFRLNRGFLIELVEGGDGERRKGWLKRLDTLGLALFGIGITSTLAAAFGLINSKQVETVNKGELAKLLQKAERGEIQVSNEYLCDIKAFLSSRGAKTGAPPAHPPAAPAKVAPPPAPVAQKNSVPKTKAPAGK